jgi:hypothetical protein
MSAVVNNGPLFNARPDIEEEELNLGDLLGVVIENRWLITRFHCETPAESTNTTSCACMSNRSASSMPVANSASR